MKTKLIVFVCAMLVSFSASAEFLLPESSSTDLKTATVSTSEKPVAWTNADKQELKDQLGLLRSAFGTEEKSVEAKGALVADKALTLLEKLITQIAGTVEKMAPDVFRIMYKQQIAKAFGDLIIPWLIFFATVLYMLIVRKMWQWPGEFDEMETECVCHILFTAAFPLLLCLATCIWGFIALSHSIQYLYNPEYYAMRDLINILMGKAPL